MSHGAQEQVKQQLEHMISRRGFGFGLYDLPFVVEIGIGEGSLTVVVDLFRDGDMFWGITRDSESKSEVRHLLITCVCSCQYCISRWSPHWTSGYRRQETMWNFNR
jgi:hypothetical protein